MNDTSETIATSLPRFNGDLRYWQRDVGFLDAVCRLPDGYLAYYEAQLPQVVGSLTAKEMQNLGEIKRDNDSAPYIPPEKMREEVLPDALQAIEEDIELVCNDDSEESRKWNLASVELDIMGVKAGETPIRGMHREPVIHVDKIVFNHLNAMEARYLISDLQPTVFYAGPATFKYVRETDYTFGIHVVDIDLNQGTIVAAEHGDIVRLSGATVHRAPIFEEDAKRAFVMVASSFVASYIH